MAGLVCAARARELGGVPLMLEKGDRPGGSMLISSCVIWRYRTFQDFRRECPGGDEALQRLIVERLDEGLAWLESLGAPVVQRETGNPRTVGMRFDPRGLTDALVRAAGEVRLNEAFQGPDGAVVLATGGFAASPELVARYVTPEPVALRANPWSAGDGLSAGFAQGGAATSGMDEFYGRNMADTEFGAADYVRLAQLYARQAVVVNDPKQLKNEGVGIFLISHDIHDVYDISDRISVMYHGRLVDTVKKEDVTTDDILGMIILGKRPEQLTRQERAELIG